MRFDHVFLLVLAAGCGFEGHDGDVGEPDPMGGDVADPGQDPKPDVPKPVACPGFTKVGASYYAISQTKVTRTEAVTYCSQRPSVTTAHLVTFEALAEIGPVKDAFAAQLAGGPAWTGVAQIKSGRARTNESWMNLVAGKPIPASFPWLDGEPNDGSGFYNENGQEDYAELRASGEFDDGPSARQNYALCECEPPLGQP